MNQAIRMAVLAVVIAAVAGAGGYWAGTRGKPAGTVAAGTASGAAKERRVLYYRNPMGLPDTSPVPKKDPMGMDYLPVYEGEEPAAASGNQVSISPDRVQKLGVRTEKATLAALGRQVRAAARIEPDERRAFVIAPKFEGYVERLHVAATGQAIRRGQPLFEAYSPELVSAQREYAIAAQGLQSLKSADAEAQAGMRQLAEAALQRLKNWDISEEQVRALARSGEARRTMTLRSPVDGIVTEKKAVQGMRFMPGEMLYQVADLSTVWVIADVSEQDIGAVAQGATARVTVNAYPERRFEGRVTYVYPTMNAATRTVPVRIEMANPGGLLKPGMFAGAELPAAAGGPVVTVPSSAVLDSGVRRIVFVRQGEGRFEPREVKTGAAAGDRVAVLEGVRVGEEVVVAANFLIDAESNLRAALGSFGTPGPAGEAKAGATVSHKADGRVESIDAAAGTLMLEHGPVPTLQWPAMTMEFRAAHAALLRGLKPGDAIRFEFVERAQGEWVITAVTPASAPPAPRKPTGSATRSPTDPHAGH